MVDKDLCELFRSESLVVNLSFCWKKVIYLLICETLNTLFDIGVVFEPLILRYGIHSSSGSRGCF